MKRIIYFLLCTATALVLLFGYRTSLSSRAMADSSAVAPVTAVAPATSAGDAAAAPTSTSTVTTTATAPAVAGITVPTTSSAKSSASTGKTAGKAASAATSDPAATTSSATKATSSSAVATTTSAATTTAAAAAATVTGQSVDTRWGPVQVQLTVQGGKVTAVDVLVYPNGNGRDQEINAQALPILVQETLSAQSAKIDAVSGATVTSDGYIGSLQSALDQAGL